MARKLFHEIWIRCKKTSCIIQRSDWIMCSFSWIILRKAQETNDVDVLSSHRSQSPLQINAYAYIFLMLVQLCFLNRKNEISPPPKKPTFPLLIDLMSAKVVFTDVYYKHAAVLYSCGLNTAAH